MSGKTVAVILSGCGNRDGSEIHEAVLTLWALHKHGLEYECFAPDIPQYNVVNHLTGKKMTEQRNVLTESARIARGKVRDLAQLDATLYAGIILPGGSGAAQNLSDYGQRGVKFQVNEQVSRAITAMADLGRPIGALCISPIIIAKLLPNISLTLGAAGKSAEDAVDLGAVHVVTASGEITVDRKNKIVTTPCYMLNARVDEIGRGADALVEAMIELMD